MAIETITVKRAGPGLLRTFRVTVADGHATRIEEQGETALRAAWTVTRHTRRDAFLLGIIEQAEDLAETLALMGPAPIPHAEVRA